MSNPINIREAYNFGRAINSGIDILKKDPVWVLVGSVLFSLFAGMGNNSNFDISAFEDLKFDTGIIVGMVFAMIAMQGCFALVGWLGGAWIRTGWYRLHQNLLGGMESGNALFSGSDRFVDMLIWRLLAGLISFVPVIIFGGFVLIGVLIIPESMLIIGLIGLAFLVLILFVGMVYIQMGLFFGDHLVAIDNRKPMEALKESWEMADGHRIHLFIYNFVLGLFAILGFLACCVGVIATSAITQVGITESYLLATRGHTDITPE